MLNLDVAVSSFWQLARHWKSGHKAKLELECEGGDLHLHLAAKLGHPDHEHFPAPSSPPPPQQSFKTKSSSQLRRQKRRREEALTKAKKLLLGKKFHHIILKRIPVKILHQTILKTIIQ